MDLFGIDTKTLGVGTGGLVILLALVWRAYQIFKQDAKGDRVDERISQFTTGLQAQLDKAIARADRLQVDYNSLQSEFAKTASLFAVAQARAEFLAAENLKLREDLRILHADLSTARP